MSCSCNSTPCCCTPPPPTCNCPPSPIPPWDRPVQSPLTQTIIGNDNVLLTMDVTMLVAALPGANIAVTLPAGNSLKQMKRIYIPTANVANTRTFVVSGTYAGGFTNLTFNALGTYALLEWDGSGWQMVGGNAALS